MRNTPNFTCTEEYQALLIVRRKFLSAKCFSRHYFLLESVFSAIADKFVVCFRSQMVGKVTQQSAAGAGGDRASQGNVAYKRRNSRR